MTRDELTTYRWKQLRKRVLAEETVCWLCGLPLDFDAPPKSRWAPSVDHVVPRSQGGSVFDRSNLRAAHAGHNSARGDGTRTRPAVPSPQSRRW